MTTLYTVFDSLIDVGIIIAVAMLSHVCTSIVVSACRCKRRKTMKIIDTHFDTDYYKNYTWSLSSELNREDDQKFSWSLPDTAHNSTKKLMLRVESKILFFVMISMLLMSAWMLLYYILHHHHQKEEEQQQQQQPNRPIGILLVFGYLCTKRLYAVLFTRWESRFYQQNIDTNLCFIFRYTTYWDYYGSSILSCGLVYILNAILLLFHKTNVESEYYYPFENSVFNVVTLTCFIMFPVRCLDLCRITRLRRMEHHDPGILPLDHNKDVYDTNNNNDNSTDKEENDDSNNNRKKADIENERKYVSSLLRKDRTSAPAHDWFDSAAVCLLSLGFCYFYTGITQSTNETFPPIRHRLIELVCWSLCIFLHFTYPRTPTNGIVLYNKREPIVKENESNNKSIPSISDPNGVD